MDRRILLEANRFASCNKHTARPVTNRVTDPWGRGVRRHQSKGLLCPWIPAFAGMTNGFLQIQNPVDPVKKTPPPAATPPALPIPARPQIRVNLRKSASDYFFKRLARVPQVFIARTISQTAPLTEGGVLNDQFVGDGARGEWPGQRHRHPSGKPIPKRRVPRPHPSHRGSRPAPRRAWHCPGSRSPAFARRP